MESPENSSPLETESLSSHEETTTRNKTKNHPRRFSDEQIKSLESLFNLEPKLEPRKKLQIATDLGLHPHQVAIWFQNKRARWKSKQIEHQYKLLKFDYDDLSTRFEDLKREKLSLQIQELSNLVKKDAELKEYPNSSSEGMDHNDDDKIMAQYFEKTCDQELVSWREDEEEEKELSQTWRNLSTSFAPEFELVGELDV